jgi:hypothetical protein
MTTKREDLLRKVRALLVKANDRAVTPAEADAFRAKADELMIAYAIEEFELHKGDENVKPVLRYVDFNWFWDSEFEQSVRTSMWQMMLGVYNHCRIRVVPEKYRPSGDGMPVIGFDTDLDYADLLFTSLMLQLATATNPKPTRAISYEENLEAMHSAGITWPEIARRMVAADFFPPGWTGGKTLRQIEHKMTRDYRNWAAEHGHERPYPTWQKHRRSFAAGFVTSVGQRLYEMSQRNKAQTSSDGNPYALIIRDIYEVVKAEALNIFPDLDTIREERKSKKPVKFKEYSIDYDAYGKGRVAGEEADIVSPSDQRLGSRRGIGA